MNYKKILFLAVALIILSSLIYILLNNSSNEIDECSVDSDCIQETCCHSASCVPKSNAPDCSDTLCTMECVPGTLDCGQGQCGCINNKCGVVMNE